MRRLGFALGVLAAAGAWGQERYDGGEAAVVPADAAAAVVAGPDGGSTAEAAAAAPDELPAEGTTEGNAEGLDQLADLLNTPVVTASLGGDESAALAPANVVPITRDEILRRGWRSLSEVLSNQPGFYVIDDHVNPSVGVRGFAGGLRAGTRYVKIMINGVPVSFRPDLTSFIGLEFIPIEVVERVEIAKGPLSAVYGANAFIATVNVITRQPNIGFTGEAAARLTLTPKLGWGGGAMTAYGTGGAALLLSFSTSQLDRSGLEISQTFPEQDRQLPNYRLFFGKQSRADVTAPASAYAQLSLHSETLGNLVVQGGLQQVDSIGNFQLNSVLTDQTRIAMRNVWTNARWERSWRDWLTTWVTAGYSTGAPTRDEKLYLTGTNDFSYTRNFNYHAFDAAVGIDLTRFSAVTLSLGADFSFEQQQVLFYTQTFNVQQGRRRPGESVDLIFEDDVRNVPLRNFGAYLQAVSAPFDNLPLRLSANFRVDVPNLFDVQYSWRAAASYRWSDNLVTKLIAGRAYQTPSAVMLFGQPGFGFNSNVVGRRTMPSLDALRPQTLHSVEAVVIARLFDRLSLEGAIYWQQLDQKIEFVQVSNNFVAQNLGTLQNAGVELNARLTFERVRPFLSGGAQWTLGRRSDTGAAFIDGFPPPEYPTFFGIAGVTGGVREIHLEGTAQLKAVGARGSSQSNTLLDNDSRYVLPAFYTVDLSVQSTGLYLFDKNAETRLSVNVRNLLDERHSEPGYGGFDIPQLGRTFFFEIRQTF
ncbi:MAG: TonB-dependent receptor [Archangiaceae bacterium]|nr:TonB-dependent receptor [Archangiaceae bacterium]